ncbi:hypothetical protein JOL62DRAFT_225965 [Phyllosticta paracitricarpa]
MRPTHLLSFSLAVVLFLPTFRMWGSGERDVLMADDNATAWLDRGVCGCIHEAPRPRDSLHTSKPTPQDNRPHAAMETRKSPPLTLPHCLSPSVFPSGHRVHGVRQAQSLKEQQQQQQLPPSIFRSRIWERCAELQHAVSSQKRDRRFYWREDESEYRATRERLLKGRIRCWLGCCVSPHG